MTDFARIGYRKLKHGAEAYEFVEWLGKGGFGEVFRARRVSDRREVAVKRLFSAGQSARFVREAKILQSAAHPNLVGIMLILWRSACGRMNGSII